MHRNFLDFQTDDEKLILKNELHELIKHGINSFETPSVFIALKRPELPISIFWHEDALDFTDGMRTWLIEFCDAVVRKKIVVAEIEGKLFNADGLSGTPETDGYVVFGRRLLDATGTPLGAFVVARPKRQIVERDRLCLHFIANAASILLQYRQSVFQLNSSLQRERQIQQDIKAAEQKFSALAQNVPGAIFRYCRQPGMPDTIEFMSPGCVDIWGYPPEELEGDPSLLWSAILPEDFDAMASSVQQSQDQLSQWQHRWRIRTKAGLLKWLQSYGTPYLTPEGGVAWNTLILDVTVEQEAQIALAANTRLLYEAQKLESIGRLAGGVAHDFNNLLAVILGNAEVIHRAQLGPDEAESVSEIIEASQRGAGLVRQLLSFARRSDLRATTADVQQVLNEVDRLLRRVLPANISLEVVQRAGLWPVHIDRNMFESALLNLVINGRDAMSNGGAITVETSNIRVDHDYITSRDEDVKPGRYVMVAVTDTGAGIDEADLPYIFEPFYSTKGMNEGVGLGLSMVQGFVKQSGGVIRVYSEVNRGTSVKMFFPASEQAPPVPYDTSPDMPTASHNVSGTILLVEDQAPVLAVLEKAISLAGYNVITAKSGDQAIDIYQSRHEEIDIIVTDVVMPGSIQGPHLVKLARKINNDLPALYMSGYPHEANVHGNGVRGSDISLMKPIRRNDLLTALAKLRRST